MKIVQLTEPADLFEWDYLKTHTNIDDDDARGLMVDFARECTEFAELETARCFANRTLAITFYEDDISDSSRLYLPRGPVVSVTSVVANGVTLSASDYEDRRIGNTDFVYLKNTTSAPITVTCVVGYGTKVPLMLKRAIAQQAAYWYRHREAYSDSRQYIVEHAMARIYELLNALPVNGG